MKEPVVFKSGLGALIVAVATSASLAVGPVYAAPADSSTYADSVHGRDSSSSEAGTIPAARPGLPEISRGVEGPIRSEDQSRSRGDPSIRDSNPLTVNGLWETHPGNIVTTPQPQEQ